MSAAEKRPVRVFYVDDSGVDSTGWVVFGWLSFLLPEWRKVLAHRLAWRKELYDEVSIPASFGLHTGEFLGARGVSDAPSERADWNTGSRKFIRRKRVTVLEAALANIRACSGLTVGVAHRHTPSRHRAFAHEKAEVYAQLVAHFDDQLAAQGETGMLILDGDGSDTSYTDGHRSLPLHSRSLLEDPLYQRSSGSQLIQMADLVAYAGYQHLLRDPEKNFAWNWFDTYLAPLTLEGSPVALPAP